MVLTTILKSQVCPIDYLNQFSSLRSQSIQEVENKKQILTKKKFVPYLVTNCHSRKRNSQGQPQGRRNIWNNPNAHGTNTRY